MTGGDQPLERPLSLVSRFRIDGAGAVTHLVDGQWIARPPQQALVGLRAYQRRRLHTATLEVEEVTAGNAQTIARFGRLGTSVEVIGTRQFPSTMSTLLAAAVDGRWEDVRAELAVGADPAVRDTLGNTVLHYAVLRGDVELLRRLVDDGVPVGFRNVADRSAEDIARERGRHVVASWLACRALASDPDDGRSVDLGSRFGHLIGPLVLAASVALTSAVVAAVGLGPVGWAVVIALGVVVGTVVGPRLRGPRPTWSPVRIGAEGIEVRRWLRRRTLAFADVTALAIDGLVAPASTSGVVVLGTRATGFDSEGLALDQLERDGLTAADRAVVVAHADRFERVRTGAVSTRFLASVVLPLLEGGVPVGPLVHRVLEHRGWSALRLAAAPLRRSPTWQLTAVEAPPRDGPPSPPDAIAVFPTGWVGAVADGFDGRRVTRWVTVDEAVDAARRRAGTGRSLVVDSDPTFPWVGTVVARLRDTGVEVVAGGADVAAPPSGSADALITQITTGQRDLAVDLIRSGWDLDRTDPWRRGPLAYAVATHDLEVVTALLRAGADPMAVDDGGRMPCSLARATWGDDDPVTVACESATRTGDGPGR